MDRIVHKFWLSKLRIKIKNHFFILKMDIKKWKFWCFSDLTDRSAVRGRTAVRSVRSEIGPHCGPIAKNPDRSAVFLPKTRTADRSAVGPQIWFGPQCGPIAKNPDRRPQCGPCGRTAYPPCSKPGWVCGPKRTALRSKNGPHCGPRTALRSETDRTDRTDRTAVRNSPNPGPQTAVRSETDRTAVRAVRAVGPHGPQCGPCGPTARTADFFRCFFWIFLKKIHIFRIKKGRLIFFFAARFARRLKT